MYKNDLLNKLKKISEDIFTPVSSEEGLKRKEAYLQYRSEDAKKLQAMSRV